MIILIISCRTWTSSPYSKNKQIVFPSIFFHGSLAWESNPKNYLFCGTSQAKNVLQTGTTNKYAVRKYISTIPERAQQPLELEKLRLQSWRIHFLSPRCLQAARRHESQRDSPEDGAASQLPVNHGSYVEVGGSGRQPERLLVGVASVAPTSLGPIGPDRLAFSTAALFRDASLNKYRAASRKKVNLSSCLVLVLLPHKMPIFFFYFFLNFFSHSARYSGTCARSRIGAVGMVSDKANVSHEKVNIMACIEIHHW